MNVFSGFLWSVCLACLCVGLATAETVHVRGYTRKDGTYVHAYDRSSPKTGGSTSVPSTAAATTVGTSSNASAAENEQAQLAPARSLSVSAKEIGSGNNVSHRWMTSWGSYDRDFFSRQDVEVEAHNLSRLPAKIIIDFYFVGQPLNASEPRKLFSKRTFTMDVSPGYLKHASLGSDVIRSNAQRYVALGEQYSSGYHITGWFLQASTPNEPAPFSSVSSNPAWIERMDWFAPALARFQKDAPQTERSIQKKSTAGATSPLVPRTETEPDPTATQANPAGSSQAATAVMLTKSVPVTVSYGVIELRAGATLPLVARAGDKVRVRYDGADYDIPISATDLK